MKAVFIDLAAQFKAKIKHPSHLIAPLDIGYCASVLEGIGYKTSLMKTNLRNIEDIEAYFIKERPDFAIIKPFINSERFALEVSQKIKRYVSAILFIGPVSTVLYRKFLFRKSPVNACILEDPESVLPQLLDAINHKKGLSDIAGIAYFDEKVSVNKSSHAIDIDSLPFPKHELFLDETYSLNYPVRLNEKMKLGFMVASRGCPYSCIFCSPFERSSYGKKHLSRKIESVIAEMGQLEKKGINAIYFVDDIFTLDRRWAEGFCDSLIARENKVKWIVQTRIDCLDEHLLGKMEKAGCSTICLGIESCSDRILKILSKNSSYRQIKKTLGMINAKGIMSVGYFIIGNPTETKEEIKFTIKEAQKLPLDMVQVHFFTPYPGANKHFEGKDKSSFYKFIQNNSFAEIQGKELQALQKEFYRSYYIRPSFIMRYLAKNWSFVLHNLDGQKNLIFSAVRYMFS